MLLVETTSVPVSLAFLRSTSSSSHFDTPNLKPLARTIVRYSSVAFMYPRTCKRLPRHTVVHRPTLASSRPTLDA